MNRRDLIVIENCRNSNPNGDMAAGNQPRVDFETGLGLMSDTSIKRRIRDAVFKMHGQEEGYALLINNDGRSLEEKAQEILESLNVKDIKEMSPKDRSDAIKAAVCEKYWDARIFGAAIANFQKLGVCDGQITGPVQVAWGESVEPIIIDELYITRTNAATEKDLQRNKSTEIAPKWITNGQYVYELHLCDNGKTGISEKDYQYLLEGIMNRWELNRTSTKSGMEVETVIEFIHDSQYGNASMATLRKAVVRTCDDENAPRKHYSYSVVESKLPKGVKVEIH